MQKETGKIYLPFIPSQTENFIKVNGYRILIKPNYWLYTKTLPELNQQFITMDTNVCNGHIINTNSIVEIEPVTLVKVHLKNLGNKNIKNFPINDIVPLYYWFRGTGVVLDFINNTKPDDYATPYVEVTNYDFLEGK